MRNFEVVSERASEGENHKRTHMRQVKRRLNRKRLAPYRCRSLPSLSSGP